MPSIEKSELQELVDSPNETLEVEYKIWLDLSEGATPRADLARHIAALANHGGGKIVFGMTDEMHFACANPYPNINYDRDLIAGVVKKYLEPPFQCDVHVIKSGAGNDHPVIIVPPHGATPICAKASGPMVAGRTTGISQGTYYTRKPGPESAPILTGAEWAPIIRRCAMHDPAAVLGAIDSALRGVSVLSTATTDNLKTWHDAAHAAFLQDLGRLPNVPPGLAKWHWQMSYAIERGDGQQLNPNELKEILRQLNGELTDLVRTGWSMFHVFGRRGLEPYFNTDVAAGQGEQDFLECALLRDPDVDIDSVGQDMWRVSALGMATLIRDYWEDGSEWNKEHGLIPGTLFSPNLMARSLAEFVRHARGLSERFDTPMAV